MISVPKIYQHEYLPLSVYGNVVSLLRDYGVQSGVHLDIGCGYGAIAEPIRDELGLTYVGFDRAEDGLDSLRDRGFEVHTIDLLEPEQAESVIRGALGDRRIASITFLDTLEHITTGPSVLKMLRRLAAQDATPLVLCIPNVTHKDLALKLMIGRWDITEAGLLDHTHVGFYNEKQISRLMTAIGWRQIGARDWLLEHSDQAFPLSAPVLNPTLPVGHFLRRLINQANPAAIVNQLVRLYEPAKPQDVPLCEDRAEPAGPFLSVVLAVQAGQFDEHRALLSGLAEQTYEDFELLIVVHPCQRIDQDSLAPVLAPFPASFCRRVVAIPCPHNNLVRALNAAIPALSGRYVAVLQNGDVVRPDWSATFAQLAENAQGALLRLGAIEGKKRYPVQGSPSAELLPIEFEIHRSPANFAVPAGIFRDLGFRLDPELGPAAYWHVVAQASLLCGVAATASAPVSFNGNVQHPSEEVISARANEQLLAQLNAHPLLLPAGSVVRIQQIRSKEAALETENERLHADISAARAENKRPYAGLQSIFELPLVRAFLTSHFPNLAKEFPLPTELHAQGRPFLSIVTRTQGRSIRLQTLRDTLMCLAGQTCMDFELLLVVHSDDGAARKDVEALVAEFPRRLQESVRVLTCTRPGRAAPLNDALSETRGQYIAVLDDDDFIFGHWVEKFRDLARDAPGAVLRAACTRQDFELGELPGRNGLPRATSWFKMDWPATYDAVAHLRSNYTPFMSVAFPAAVFRSLESHFDESLSTTEDWELTTRAAMLCGVATTADITAVYRWWTNAESSTFFHHPQEWAANRQRVLEKMDSQPILLPSGATKKINELIENGYELEARVKELDSLRVQSAERMSAIIAQIGELDHVRCQLIERNEWMCERLLAKGMPVPWSDVSTRIEELAKKLLKTYLESRSWRLTRPLRRMKRLFGKREFDLTVDSIPLSFPECQKMLWEVRRSQSWRLTAPMREVERIVRRLAK